MELEDLGWNEFFQEQVEQLGIAEITIGRVSRVDLLSYEVISIDGEMEARLAGRMRKDPSSVPGVGDWVLLKEMETGNMIFHLLTRTSKISRRTPGKETSEQLVAANIDLMFIVMGLDDDYNPRRLERYLTMVSGSGATPVVILNKTDLIDDLDVKMKEILKICGEISVHSISALKGDGLDIIRGYLKQGVTIALVGSSGVGKSTLINSLIGDSVQKTGDVREKDSKGRHVTTSRELMVIPGGGMIIDNPGIREIQLWGDEASIEVAFADIAGISQSCRFKDCSHVSEPDCAVKRAVENGDLDEKRYNNYIKMKKELRNLEIRSSKSSEAAEKEKWRPILKGVKNYYKFKKGGR